MITEVIKFTSPYNLSYEKKELRPLKKDEVLIKTLACGICKREQHVFTGYISDRYPAIMGHEPVGEVIKVGENVRHVKKGDIVTALGEECLAKHFITEGKYVIKTSKNKEIITQISEPLMCVISAIRNSGLDIGDKVMVIGCGYMGLLLIQALSHTLSSKITAMDLDEHKLNLAKKYGADESYLDINKERITEKFDVVFEVSGSKEGLITGTNFVRNGGTICLFGHQTKEHKYIFDQWHYKGIKVLNTVPWISQNLSNEFKHSVELMKKGVFNTKELITHTNHFDNVESALYKSLEDKNYIKGVIIF